MRVRIDLNLDFDGHHALDWTPASGPQGVEVPRATLERWAAERDAFQVALLRWKRVIDEVEETLFRTERERHEQDAAATRLAAKHEHESVAVPASARRG